MSFQENSHKYAGTVRSTVAKREAREVMASGTSTEAFRSNRLSQQTFAILHIRECNLTVV